MPDKFDLKDFLFPIILIVIFLPVYTFYLYDIPNQINTDEVTIMLTTKTLVSNSDFDFFGISNYFDFPKFPFLIFGYIGNLLGGINLMNMRFIHASFGLLIIILSYFLFRLSLNKFTALCASIILGSNHALIGISRMAMRDNSGLFIEVLSLLVLYLAILRKNLAIAIIGGLVLGLSFYVYFPARISAGIWFLFLLIMFFTKSRERKFIAKLFVFSFLGFILMLIPIYRNTLNIEPSRLNYQREQILLFEEGRRMQQKWIGAESVEEGIKTNVTNGLTIFNNKKSDLAYIYSNPNHGFFDPVSGILIWIGILFTLFGLLVRRILSTPDVLFISGLTLLVLIFSFVTGKTPNYTRLLIILPFTAYFCVRWVEDLKKIPVRLKNLFLAVICILVLTLNLDIYSDFVFKGLKEGNDVGGTGRYVESRNSDKYSFYLLADNYHYYYNWGEEYMWKSWVGFFAKENQKVEVVEVEKFIADPVKTKPFSLLMSRNTFQEVENIIKINFPNFIIHNIKPDGSILAIEVN